MHFLFSFSIQKKKEGLLHAADIIIENSFLFRSFFRIQQLYSRTNKKKAVKLGKLSKIKMNSFISN